MAGLVIDAGPLVAAERNDRRFWGWWQVAVWERGVVPVVPSRVVAQVWRDGARQARLARVLEASRILPLTDSAARRVGRLLAASGTSDIVDAAVVETAARLGATILTTDLELLSHGSGVQIVQL